PRRSALEHVARIDLVEERRVQANAHALERESLAELVEQHRHIAVYAWRGGANLVPLRDVLDAVLVQTFAVANRRRLRHLGALDHVERALARDVHAGTVHSYYHRCHGCTSGPPLRRRRSPSPISASSSGNSSVPGAHW